MAHDATPGIHSRISARSLSDLSRSLHHQAIEGGHRVDAALQREPDTRGERTAATDRQNAAVIPGPTDVQIVEQAQHPVME